MSANGGKSDDDKPSNVVSESGGDGPVNTNSNNNNDLVVRDGFPALKLPGGRGPNIKDEEPLPRHKFWGNEQALSFDCRNYLLSDCETVFSARTRQDDQAYSAGITYFLPCQMKPRCALEALVMSIFKKHTESLEEQTFMTECSGAEWWTLILDDDDDDDHDNDEKKDEKQPATKEAEEEEDDDDDVTEGDEVGLHFDADYGLEAQAPGFLLHPRLATVTYLSDFGSPTLVLDLKSSPPMDKNRSSLQGSIQRGWLSQPKIGKHIAFDGRLLHGAPSTFFPGARQVSLSYAEPPSKKQRHERKRITLLVNIWLNHCPLDAEPMEDQLVEQMKTPWEEADANGGKNGGDGKSSIKSPYSWNSSLNFAQPVELKRVQLAKSKDDDAAGSEEVVLCGRLVTVSYGASMNNFHAASKEAGLVEVVMEPGVVALEVGDEVAEEEEDDDDEDDN